MNPLRVTFLLLVATTALYAQTQQHSAVCVYGTKNFSGSNDVMANISVSALHDGVEIKVYVTDDLSVVGNNVLKSDHIEFWMAMDTIARRGYVYDGKMYNSVSDSGDELSFLDFLKERQGYQEPLKEEATEKDVRSDVDFIGMRHWAIDLKNESVLLLDTEKYYGFSTLDSTTSFIKVIKSKKENGYQYTIHLTAEAIGFSASNSMTKLYYMVDVFDVDQVGGTASVLSSNPKRKWGESRSFTQLNFPVPLELSIDQNPDNVVSGAFYAIQKDSKTLKHEWRCYYPDPQATSAFSSFDRTHYSRIDFHSSSKMLSDGSVVEKRMYNGPDIVVTRFGKNEYKYSSISYNDNPTDPVEIEFVSTGKYAVKIQSFTPHNPWGQGQCGACLNGHLEFIIINKGNEYPIYSLNFTDQEMHMEYEGKTLEGNFKEARWTKNFSTVEVLMEVYVPWDNKDKNQCLVTRTLVLPYYDLSEQVELINCPD